MKFYYPFLFSQKYEKLVETKVEKDDLGIDINDSIYYYGTKYVKETAVRNLMNNFSKDKTQIINENLKTIKDLQEKLNSMLPNNLNTNEDNSDNESVCSVSSASSLNSVHNIGKKNQLKYCRHNMRLKHTLVGPKGLMDVWYGHFDAELNKVVRTDKIEFETLRQFSRVHHQDINPLTHPMIENVWIDPYFQYEDENGYWFALANLRKNRKIK